MGDREFELKLQVPPEELQQVRMRVGSASSRRTRLQARYFDTPDGRLSAAGIALRIRREGLCWVQTLKVSVDGQIVNRIEHNVIRRGVAQPELELDLHDGTPAGAHLRAALTQDDASNPSDMVWAAGVSGLQELFRTDILRTHREHRLKGGSVALALDEGMIVSGGHRWPVCELEIEHISGATSVVFDLAEQWSDRYGLWIDTRSKAERGYRLCRARLGHSISPDHPMMGAAISASTGLLAKPKAGVQPKQEAAGVALNLQQALVRPLLPALLANASELAGCVGSDEHIHQLRVSIRRLRSVRRLGDRWGPTWPEPVVNAILGVFRRLGQQRDVAVVDAEFAEHLRNAGCPVDRIAGHLHENTECDLHILMRSRELQRAWIWLLRLSHEPQPDVHLDAIVALLNVRLERWSTEIVQMGRRFVHLQEPEQHELRKRIKRLRYALDSSAALGIPQVRLPRREFLEAISNAQAVLGHYCDLMSARDLWQQACEGEPKAWFAVGWFSAEIQRGKPDVIRSLKRLGKVERRWRVASGDASKAD